MQWQQKDWNGRKMIHDIDHEGNLHLGEQSMQDRSFDAVQIKYTNLDRVKSIIFTKLESSTSQRQSHIVNNVDTGANGNLIPLMLFKSLCPRSTIENFVPQR